MADSLAILAAGWGVLMAVSPILQVRRILQRHSSDDVSLGYLLVLEIGFLLWIAYGAAAGSLVLIIPNSVALLVGLTLIAVALRLRRSHGRGGLRDH